MKHRVTATEAAKKFSEILNRVAYKGDSFVVERRGRPLCEIAPIRAKKLKTRDLVKLLKSGLHPDEEYLKIEDEIVRNRQPVAPSPWDR